MAQSMVAGVDIVTLVAIPFFMLAGELMNESGITERLVRFAQYFVGRIRGGLAYVTVIVNVIMAGVSGSAVADASAVSSVLLPAMARDGYDRRFAAAINASAAVIGPIIPPSIPMVFIAVISDLSIGRLFLGGVVPGLAHGRLPGGDDLSAFAATPAPGDGGQAGARASSCGSSGRPSWRSWRRSSSWRASSSVW